jgi:hypothetical protein
MHGERWQVPLVLLEVLENIFDHTRQVIACHPAVDHERVVEVTIQAAFGTVSCGDTPGTQSGNEILHIGKAVMEAQLLEVSLGHY